VEAAEEVDKMALNPNIKLPKLPINTKFLAVLIVLVVGIIYAYNTMFYKQQKQKIAERQKTLDSLKVELNVLKQRVADLEKTRAALDSLRAIWIKVQRLLPDKEDIPTWYDEIVSISRRSGISIDEFTPLAPIRSDKYVEYPFTLKFKGTFHSLGTFFSFVANAPWITEITGLTLSSASSKEGELPITIEGSCQLSTFVFNPEFLQGSSGG